MIFWIFLPCSPPLAGLLHDTGKAVYRAGGQRSSHSAQGYQFLCEMLTGADWKPILDCVRYHHASELESVQNTLPKDSPAYIVYLADTLSATADPPGDRR